ncbi:MAG: MgtC/SapB family protein [Candidatus Omnitrophica bacterium]|nr:MgtC/SapB family protein [Candidatus Omnitrophota bacterium]
MSFLGVEGSFWLKIILCVACGILVGIERRVHRKTIDIRTCVLICLGTMVFIYLGLNVTGEKDNTRVLGQVVTGIGFLGAGAIVTREGLVVGLTSASVVWVLAAIGAAIGLERYSLGIVISLVTMLVLVVLQALESIAAKANR